MFITGASGGGKTTLLRLINRVLAERDDAHVINFDDLDAAHDQPIVEAIGGSLEQATGWLALAGLNDAAVMLRKPNELSDGQRYRYRLARTIAQVEAMGGADRGRRLPVVLADELGSTLDRATAKIISRNVRKWVSRSRASFIAATTHDDLLESLSPDTLIVQQPGEGIEVLKRGEHVRTE